MSDVGVATQTEIDESKKFLTDDYNKALERETKGLTDEDEIAVAVHLTAEKYDRKYSTQLAVISQQRALMIADIEEEWINRCVVPQSTTKELSHIKTLNDSLATMSPTLAKIRKIKGDKYVKAFLRAWIVYLQGYLNIKNKLSEAMIDDAVETILTDFYYLTIPDVKIVFTEAKNGVYGEFYESLSIPKMISWFDDYGIKRMDECAARSESEHSYAKNETTGWKPPRERDVLSAQDLIDIERGKE